MAETIVKPAIKIAQGRHTLYAAGFTLADFQRGSDFCRVDKLDVAGGSTGFQRLLDERRAKSLAKDLVSAAENDEVFLPTSILLATEGNVAYDDRTREISFPADPKEGVCPFNVVDGQHRIEGLRQFAQATPGMEGFPVAVNIAVGLSHAQQMLQFLTVNTRQRKVDTGLAQHITARFTEMKGLEDIPYLPPWLRREVEKGTDLPAKNIVAFLNDRSDSPWHNKIERVNSPRDARYAVKEHAFIKSVKSYILSSNNPLSRKDADKRNDILKNYWCAVAEFFAPDSAGSIVFKTNGMDFFHFISGDVVGWCDDLKDWKVDTIKRIFRKAHDELEDAPYMLSDWWESGSRDGAAGTNKGGVMWYASELSKGIRDACAASEGDI